MSEPIFLALDEVYRIHAQRLAEHGGSKGVRDAGLIESALASAKNTFYYANGDSFDVAEKKKTKADLAEIFRRTAGLGSRNS